jgi:L-alanine-DL-glutamate epimerase-like enolase superfamily enzyme
MRDEYRYTAIMGLADPQTFKTLFRQYRQLGLSDFKVKLSGQLSLDRVLLEQMRPDREYIRVRADANNLWTSADEAARYLKELEWPIYALEEPLQVADIDELEVLHDKTGIQIILDESLLRLEQLAPLGRNAGIWNANVRVSKMGGLLRSLEMIGKLRELDIDIIIGAHVGETSLLTRAALILADAAGRHLAAQEGAFGEHLLQSDPMTTLIQFGKEGKLNTGSMNYRNYHGFGLSCNPV